MWLWLMLALRVAPTPERQPDHADGIEWSAPPSCPTREEVVAKIIELSPEVGAGGLSARAEAVASGDAYTLHVAVETESGTTQRRIDAPRCRELADAFAVLVAVAAAPDPPPADDVPLPAARSLPPRASESAASTATRRRIGAPGGRLRVAPFLELGTAPGPSGGPIVAGGIAWPVLRLEVGASWTARRRIDYGPPGSGVDVQLAAAHLRVCPGLEWRRGEAWVCGLLDAGALVGQGRGVERSRTVVAPWVAAGLGPGGSVRLRDPVHVFLELQGLVAATRPAFELQDSMGLYTAGPVSVRFVLGIQLVFPPIRRNRGRLAPTSDDSRAQ